MYAYHLICNFVRRDEGVSFFSAFVGSEPYMVQRGKGLAIRRRMYINPTLFLSKFPLTLHYTMGPH